MKFRSLFFLLFAGLAACNDPSPRTVVSLDGVWEVAKTDGELPELFPGSARVPGLVDLAQPPLDTAGFLYPEGWYWHRRSFELPDGAFDKIELKVFKAKYHTKVYLNGAYVGENPYCFTPSYFDLKPFLKGAGETNELIIGVGCRSQLPDTIPDGHDYEKYIYIPGIYDHVQITLTNRPSIENIQCVPDIAAGKVRVVARIGTDASRPPELRYRVVEVASGRRVAAARITPTLQEQQGGLVADFEIGIPDAKLWTPESPHLYELTLDTGADRQSVRFGMRTLRFDPERKLALLNEEPYYMRGTNVCIGRFFEEPTRGDLPWDERWVTTLHERFKGMHWNTMRYCIGFPPERWYDLCDSLGFMLQDEYPVWRINLTKPTVTLGALAEEYRRWMRERWNHPSVVVWDAQNETINRMTTDAIRLVRHLDLSDRPWENGWSTPVEPTDLIETHPYMFGDFHRELTEEQPEGYKKHYFGTVRQGKHDANDRGPDGKPPVPYPNVTLINEYGWLWVNRDGSPTPLSANTYRILWRADTLTPEGRLELYARHLAMLTEYWRAHRQFAGVLDFCALGHSRPGGATTDHWADVPTLTWEEHYLRYVRPAFSPVGLMVDLWERDYPAGSTWRVPVRVVNDLPKPYADRIRLILTLGEETIFTLEKPVALDALATAVVPFEVTMPELPGAYRLRAELMFDGESIFSLRDIPVVRTAPAAR